MSLPSSSSRTVSRLTGQEDFNGLTQTEATLPSTWYYDPNWYSHELEKIFYTHWLYLCHASTLRERRAFRRFTIGNQEIFVVRNEQDELKGFHNTCRHRGSALCLADQGTFPGRLIRCPYHQWSYTLDGHLVSTTSKAHPGDFDRTDYPLFPVSVREWRGGVFASLADDPPNIEQGFGRGSEKTENWPMEKLVVGHTYQKIMRCNWKIFWENFNECLHCPNVHPELCELVPLFGRGISHYRDDPNWQHHQHHAEPRYTGGLRPGAQTWSGDGQALNVRFDSLSEEEIQRGQSYFVSLPSVYIAAHVDYMRTVRILPLAPEETEIAVEWLFLPQAMAQDDFDRRNITDFATLVMEQDADASEINQRGIRSRKYRQGVLMPEEYHVKNFQDWVRRQVGRTD